MYREFLNKKSIWSILQYFSPIKEGLLYTESQLILRNELRSHKQLKIVITKYVTKGKFLDSSSLHTFL
jgi:hypothetical protein